MQVEGNPAADTKGGSIILLSSIISSKNTLLPAGCDDLKPRFRPTFRRWRWWSSAVCIIWSIFAAQGDGNLWKLNPIRVEADAVITTSNRNAASTLLFFLVDLPLSYFCSLLLSAVFCYFCRCCLNGCALLGAGYQFEPKFFLWRNCVRCCLSIVSMVSKFGFCSILSCLDHSCNWQCLESIANWISVRLYIWLEGTGTVVSLTSTTLHWWATLHCTPHCLGQWL